MQFLSRIFDRDRKVSRIPQTGRSPRRNRAQVGVESMEGRNLLSSISMAWGQININASQASGNQAYVWNDGNNIDVWVNGEFAQFDSSQVNWVSYNGGSAGWDHFENDTNLNSSITVSGGHNTVLGGWAYNYVVMHDDYNYYESRGGSTGGYIYNGPNDTVVGSNVYFTVYNDIPANPWQWW